MKLHRPGVPTDAIDTNMKLWVLVDVSRELLAVQSGMDSKGKNESWSHAPLINLITGSNTLWLLGQVLSNWMHIFILAGDAQISLYWVLPDKLKLGLWHRTRNKQPATDVIVT